MSDQIATIPRPATETHVVQEPRPAPPRPVVKTESERLLSVDAYRGFVMLAMASSGLGMSKLIHDPYWRGIADQFDHRRWIGCTFWDLIQPSFMFIVGVSMPFAFAVREQKGDSWLKQFGHAIMRALTLILIGFFLDAYGSNGVHLMFIRVLQQIALGYLIAFLVLKRSVWEQAGLALLLLVVHTVAYYVYAYNHDLYTWNVSWWSKQDPDPAHPANIGMVIDFFMGTKMSTGGYVTLNFVTSTSTILGGVLAGRLLRSDWKPETKMMVLIGAGLAGWAVGGLLGEWVLMIKRLWTASFAIYAAGWTCLMLAAFYGLIEGLKWRRWAWPFTVVGMNSIAMYIMASLLRNPIEKGIAPLLWWEIPHLRAEWQPVQMAVLVTFVLWLFCLWLYQRKIFFKV